MNILRLRTAGFSALMLYVISFFSIAHGEIQHIRHYKTEHFIPAWGTGDNISPSELSGDKVSETNNFLDPSSQAGSFYTTYSWQFAIDHSAQPPLIFRSKRLNDQEPAMQWGALPQGDAYSSMLIAHGRIWIFVQRANGWTLYHASADAKKARWTPVSSDAIGEVMGFYLNQRSDPVVILKQDSTWLKQQGLFTGGGKFIQWEQSQQISQIQANQLLDSSGNSNSLPDLIGEFDLKRKASLLAFSWDIEQSQDIKIQYRITPDIDKPYSPWSKTLTQKMVKLKESGRFFQYQVSYKNKTGINKILPDLQLTYTFDKAGDVEYGLVNNQTKSGGSAGSGVGGGLGLSFTGPTGFVQAWPDALTSIDIGSTDAATSNNQAASAQKASQSAQAASSQPADAPSNNAGPDASPPNQSDSQKPANNNNQSAAQSPASESQAAPNNDDSASPTENDSAPQKNPNKSESPDDKANSPQLNKNPETNPENNDDSVEQPEDSPNKPGLEPDQPQPESPEDKNPDNSDPSDSPNQSSPSEASQNQPEPNQQQPDENDDSPASPTEKGDKSSPDQSDSSPESPSKSSLGSNSSGRGNAPGGGDSDKNDSEEEAEEKKEKDDQEAMKMKQQNREPAEKSGDKGSGTNNQPDKSDQDDNGQPKIEESKSEQPDNEESANGNSQGIEDEGAVHSEKSDEDTLDQNDQGGNPEYPSSGNEADESSVGLPDDLTDRSMKALGGSAISMGKAVPVKGAGGHNSRIRFATADDIEDVSAAAMMALAGLSEKKEASWWWMVGLLLLLSMILAEGLRRRKSKLAQAEDDPAELINPEIESGDWREQWIEEIDNGEGNSNLLYFQPQAIAAQIQGNSVLLMNQDGRIYKAPLKLMFDAGDDKPKSLTMVAAVKQPFKQAHILMRKQNLFIFGTDDKDAKQALQIALPSGGKPVKGKKIPYPSDTELIQRLFYNKGQIWVQGSGSEGQQILSASAANVKSGKWSRELPLVLEGGQIAALSSGCEPLIAGIPRKDIDHLWVYKQDDSSAKRWQAIAKTPCNSGKALMHAAEKRCVLVEPMRDGRNLSINLFPRDEQGHFTARACNSINLPHSCDFFAMEIFDGNIYLLGRDAHNSSQTGTLMMFTARIGELLKNQKSIAA